jgi:hypothetical protein
MVLLFNYFPIEHFKYMGLFKCNTFPYFLGEEVNISKRQSVDTSEFGSPLQAPPWATAVTTVLPWHLCLLPTCSCVTWCHNQHTATVQLSETSAPSSGTSTRVFFFVTRWLPSPCCWHCPGHVVLIKPEGVEPCKLDLTLCDFHKAGTVQDMLCSLSRKVMSHANWTLLCMTSIRFAHSRTRVRIGNVRKLQNVSLVPAAALGVFFMERTLSRCVKNTCFSQ